jgi:hypothetical protein
MVANLLATTAIMWKRPQGRTVGSYPTGIPRAAKCSPTAQARRTLAAEPTVVATEVR